MTGLRSVEDVVAVRSPADRYALDMSRTGRSVALVVVVVLSFLLAIGSVGVHSQTTAKLGNLCEQTADNPYGYCYGPVLAGGWPFPFLVDSAFESPRNNLDFTTDDPRPGWFLADWAVFGTLPALIVVAVDLWRRRRLAPRLG